MNKLVIVESPTKAKTISRFLGKDYKIESSYGHIRDLPKKEMGVDIDHDFEPRYVIPRAVQKRVTALKKLAIKAPLIILATDEDREGEAISWHLVQALDIPKEKTERIVFHEITKPAIEEALKNPRGIDIHLVDAQQARRVLDRLVGYELSPFLWKKVKTGLSAGRVQSVALRLIVEREKAIKDFRPKEYWSIEADLKKAGDQDQQTFLAKLYQIDGRALKKFDITSQAAVGEIVQNLKGATYQINAIKEKEARRWPAAPFTTSTLQQEAARKLGLSAKQTMMFAQELYETGYITYMRTDSVNLAEQALRQAQKVIAERFGKDYVLPAPRRYKTKSKGAQEAHEAVRPTDLAKSPDNLGDTAQETIGKLYELIWKRTLASQMPEAVFDETAVDIDAGSKYLFRATGQVLKFDGFIKVYTEGRDEEEEETPTGQLPKLATGDLLDLLKLEGKQHFTEPPPRYTDATLVKTLEEFGIGRPSTYAPTISTILERGYVERKARRFHPTQIGIVVNDLLVEHFPEIIDYKFTAQMEEELDEIAAGKLQWQPTIKKFYTPFKTNLEKKMDSVKKQVEQTDVPCPECGKPMVKKFGRFGQFLACGDYPKCKGRKALPKQPGDSEKPPAQSSGRSCPECNEGELLIRHSRYGQFFGCSRYPKCKFIENQKNNNTGLPCPDCKEGEIIERRTRKSKIFWGCNRYPECKYATWENPANKTETDA